MPPLYAKLKSPRERGPDSTALQLKFRGRVNWWGNVSTLALKIPFN